MDSKKNVKLTKLQEIHIEEENNQYKESEVRKIFGSRLIIQKYHLWGSRGLKR